jgi:lantibiotic transport system permease protein
VIHNFSNSFISEWLKIKRTLALWIIICGAFFTPTIIVIARLTHASTVPELYKGNGFWLQLWRTNWESMAIFLLPVGVVLVTSLITQLEYKNNTWKQLHTLPVSFATVFFSKLLVLLVLFVLFFILFNVAIYLSALIPFWCISAVPYPQAPIPFDYFLQQNGLYFLDCMPILTLQYLLGLRFKNFLVPIGIGFLIWIASVAAISWKYCYCIPYCFSIFQFLSGQKGGKTFYSPINFHYLAVGYSVFFIALGYALYIFKKDKS